MKRTNEEPVDSETLIRKARNELLMHLPFYAHILFNMKLKRVDGRYMPMPTAAVDKYGNMAYCDEFIQSLNQGKLMFVLAHEASHVGLMHMSRLNGRIPSLWNIATDLEINYMLLQETRLIPPDDGIFPDPNDGTYKLPSGVEIYVKDKTSEEVYDQLYNALKGKKSSDKDKEWADSYSPPVPILVKISSSGSNGNDSSDSNSDSEDNQNGNQSSQGKDKQSQNSDNSKNESDSSQDGNQQSQNSDNSNNESDSSQDGNQQSKSSNSQKNNKSGNRSGTGSGSGSGKNKTGKNCKGFDAHVYGNELGGIEASAIDPEDYENPEDFWKEKLISAKDSAKLRGIGVSDCLRKKLDLILEPPQIDWRHKIRIFITQGIPTDFTMKSPGRRGRSLNLYLPTTIREHVKFVVGFDCSGSISEEELMEFISECYHMTKFFPCCELIIVPWNGEVMEQHILEIKQEPTVDDLAKLTEVPSGGTTLQSFIDWANAHCDSMDNVIIFTDK